MIKLFYNKEKNNIIAKSRGKFYSLPDCKEIIKPRIILPCIPFTKNVSTSKWIEKTIDKSEISDTIAVLKKNNKVALFGFYPKYVLNGLINLL